jgi:hypothetical protein
MRRGVAISAVLLAVAAVGPGLAAGSDRPATAAAVVPQLTAEPVEVVPGGTLVLRGRGFPRNARVVLLAGPPRAEAERIGGAVTGRRGGFRAEIRIRLPSDAGRFVALACHDECRVKASARFRIVAR